MAQQVFISYAEMEHREDRYVADALCVKLEGKRIGCWVAHRDVPPGSDFIEAMYHAVKACDICLVIINGRSTGSRYVQSEVKQALDEHKIILPVRIEDVDFGPLLTNMLNTLSWLDALPPPVEKHLDKVVDQVERLLRPHPPPNGPKETLVPVPPFPPPPGAQTVGRVGLLGGTIALLLVAIYMHLLGPLFSGNSRDASTRRVIYGTRWITYEPRDFDPTKPVRFSDATLNRELNAIREAGFNGVITFSSVGDIARIPRLAKAQGFALIAGVWNPNDAVEVATAITNAQFVDAYCVGHNHLNTPLYGYPDLVRAVRHIRFRTGKPVTTTECVDRYASTPELHRLVDFLFPDAHAAIPESSSLRIDPADVENEAVAMIRSYREPLLAARKPVLLKMITHPAWDSPSGRTVQAEFFEDLLQSRRDAVPGIPLDFAISVHGAFDAKWKRGPPFYEWDRSTGLLDDDGRPRPAAKVIVRRLP